MLSIKEEDKPEIYIKGIAIHISMIRVRRVTRPSGQRVPERV